MKRILLLGSCGQLGWEAERALACLGEVIPRDYPQIDFSQPDSLRELVHAIQPNIIFNAVAYTAVDQAEKEREKARLINAVAPGVLAEAARSVSAVLVHYSTDYVFDGTKGAAYTETDATHPLNVYGETKLEGEQAVQQVGGSYLVLRTSWVYSTRRDSFVTKVLQWARLQTTLRVVTDQVSNPTWARSLAEISALVLAKGGEELYGWLQERSGLYHLAGDGCASRYEWAEAILKLDPHAGEQTVRQLLPALSAEFPSPADRPLFSALNCERFKSVFGLSLPDWKVALNLAMQG